MSIIGQKKQLPKFVKKPTPRQYRFFYMSQEDDKNRVIRVKDQDTDPKASAFDDWLHDNDYCFTVYENVRDRGWVSITVEADEEHAQIKDRIDKGYRLVIEEGE